MPAGPLFAFLYVAHRFSTYAFTVVIVGHIVVAAGILPGDRGAWRSMHLGGRLRLETARRLWPGWTERALTRDAPPATGAARSLESRGAQRTPGTARGEPGRPVSTGPSGARGGTDV